MSGRAAGSDDYVSPKHPRFELVRRLGVGSVGVVHEALDKRTGQRVALKSLRSEAPEPVRGLKREFRILAGLVHPNLLHLHELFEDERSCFISMELVEGQDALAWVEQAPNRTEAVLEVARQLTHAILFLHQRGRLHLDIKPRNVVMGGAGRLVLLDFGISRAFAGVLLEAPTLEHWGGTPGYCAPEQLSSNPIAESADWYGLGATLYELLTGYLPYDGNGPQLLKLKESRRKPIPIRMRDSAIDVGLAGLIDGLLSIDAAKRPGAERVSEFLGVDIEIGAGVLAAPSSCHSLIGREIELARLTDASELARQTGLAETELQGTSGIGKSALVRAYLAAQRRSRRGAVVLTGTSYEREWIRFNAFDTLVTSLVDAIRVLPPSIRARLVPRESSQLARLFPGFRRVPEIDEASGPLVAVRDVSTLPLRRDGFEAFAELLEAFAEERLVVLALDDVQWADRDSLALLDSLRNRPLSCPMHILTSRRLGPDEPTVPVHQDAELLHLGPLDPEAARQLAAEALCHSVEGTLIDKVLDEAGGVPLWIEQLGHRWASTGEPPSLDGLIERAVGALPRESLAALEALTVSGRPLALSQLEEFIGSDGPLRVLDELAGSGMAVPLVERSEATYDVRHARVREVVSGLIPDTRRAEIALTLADQYIARGGDDEEVARHLLAAGDSMRGAEYAVRAAREASNALAFGRSARLIEAAFEHMPRGRQVELLEELSDVLVNDASGYSSASASLAAASQTDDLCKRLQDSFVGAQVS